MKKLKYSIVALFATMGLLTSCMEGDYDDYQAPSVASAYGNDTITAHHVVTLKQLRSMSKYKTVMASYRDYKLVDDDIQLRVRVTGNDIGGNIYNKVAVQDENGDAILICIYSGGLFSYMPVGQEMLINLKGLYVGTYGYQMQIGTPYTTSSGNTYPGRMDKNLWQQHFKLVSTTLKDDCIQPVEFNSTIQKDFTNYAGKLMTLKGVILSEANGKATWAPEDNSNFSISRSIKGYPSSVVVYTSTSAKFANDVMPTDTVDITGIFTRYSSTWQILLRTADDVKLHSAK